MDIKIVRLSSGEELICKVVAHGKYKDIAILIPAGGGHITISPWLPYATMPGDGLPIKDDNVLFKVEPNADLIAEYKKLWEGDSGIVVPDKKLILE
jgi:hypothetical protein